MKQAADPSALAQMNLKRLLQVHNQAAVQCKYFDPGNSLASRMCALLGVYERRDLVNPAPRR